MKRSMRIIAAVAIIALGLASLGAAHAMSGPNNQAVNDSGSSAPYGSMYMYHSGMMHQGRMGYGMMGYGMMGQGMRGYGMMGSGMMHGWRQGMNRASNYCWNTAPDNGTNNTTPKN